MIYIPLSIVAIAAILFAAICYNLSGPKEGYKFTTKEKRVLLKAIKRVRIYYIEGHAGGLCAALENSIYARGYRGLYNSLEATYHNREYYHAKGLRTYNYNGYWWPISDVESRLKALDILEQAIIND